MLAKEFAEIFRAEHNAVHQGMLDLVRGFNHHDLPAVRQGLQRLAILTGPHFRYEEETLYPLLSDYLGAVYVEELLIEHDRTIATLSQLVHMASSDAITPSDTTTAVQQLGLLLQDVNDCNDLSVMVENMPAAQISKIWAARSRARLEHKHLLEWAREARERPCACEPCLSPVTQ